MPPIRWRYVLYSTALGWVLGLLSVWLIYSLRKPSDDDPGLPCIIHKFLPPEECQAVVDDALQKGLKPSTVVGDSPNTQELDTGRTSAGCFLTPQESLAAARVMDRVSQLLNIPKDHFEQLQVVRYYPGELYNAHYDARDGLPRLYTVLIYLTDNFEGGHTVFPNSNVDVTPEQGTAVLWQNIDPKTNTQLKSSLHAAYPVASGDPKWVCNVWIHAKKIS